MPKISVIMPLYKVENYIRESLESVLKQTLEDIEIICVDDGSPDNSGNIVEEYTKKNDNIILLRKENGGQSSARNMALEIATGKYIYFLDSDDYIDSIMLEEVYNKAEKENLDLVFFNATPFFENDDIEKENIGYIDFYNRKGDYSSNCLGQKMFSLMSQNGEFLGSPCLEIIRRSLIEENKLRFYNGIIHEDNLFTFQCIMLAKNVGYINKKYYYRRMHEESTMTKRKSMKNVEGYIVSCAEMLNFMQKCNVENEVMSYVSDYILQLYNNAYNIYRSLELEENVMLNKGDLYALHLFRTIKERSQEEKKLRKRLTKIESNIVFRIINKVITLAERVHGR